MYICCVTILKCQQYLYQQYLCNSDDSIQSWEEDSDEEISDPDQAEDVQNQDLRDFGNEEMHSTAEIHVRTQNRNRSSGKCQTVPEINWGELDEVANVAYPTF